MSRVSHRAWLPVSGSRGGGPVRLIAVVSAVIAVSLVAIAVTGSNAQASKVVYDFIGGPTGTLGGQFNTPRGVAVNSSGAGTGATAGDIYVVDSANNRIQQLHAKGQFVRAWGFDVIQSGKPGDLGTSSFEVCEVAADCKAGINTISPAPGGELSTPLGIAIDQSDGSVYVSEQGFNRVEKFSASGVFQRAFGQDVVNAGSGNAPATAAQQTLTVDATGGSFTLTFKGQTTGNIAWNAPATGAGSIQAALQGLTTIGTNNATVTGAGPYVITFAATLNNSPQPLIASASSASDPLSGGTTQEATVTNTTTGSSGFEICTPASTSCKTGVTGATAGAFAGSGGNLFTGHLAVVPTGPANAGNVVVADPVNRRVNEYTSAGAFVRSFGFDVVSSPPNATTTFEICSAATFDVCKVGAASGSGTGQFGTNGPNRIAVDSTGAIYTVEQANPNFRLQKFTPAGASLTPTAFNPAIGTAFLSGTGTANTPTDIAVGASDRLFVVKACPANDGTICPNPPTAAERRVFEFDSAGTLVDTHIDGGAIAAVNGLAANPSTGNLYLSSTTGGQGVYVITDPPNLAPAVVTGAAGVGAQDYLRTLEGTVNPSGFKVTACRFEYGPTSKYGSSTACVPTAPGLGDGPSAVAVSAETEPLEPETTYHYRLLAANVGMTGTGEDRTFTTGPAVPDSCPNASIRAAQGIGTVLLPDCMALELVDPGKKGSAPALEPEISADAERVLFRTKAAVTRDAPVLSELLRAPFVASRDAGEGRWRTTATTPADPTLQNAWEAQIAATGFSPSLESWFNVLSFGNQAERGIAQAFRGSLDGPISPLSPLFAPLNEGSFTPSQYAAGVENTRFWGASADGSHLFFGGASLGTGSPPSVTYLLGDPAPISSIAGGQNTYVAHRTVASEPSLELLARDRDGKVWGGNCGAFVGGVRDEVGENRQAARNQGAFSADGTRVYISARPSQSFAGSCDKTANKRRILERVETPTGPLITQLISSECTRVSPPCGSFDGNDNYQGASVDQSKVYFTANRQLANSDQDGSAAECSPTLAVAGCDLYLYDANKPAGERLTQVSAGETVGSHEAGKEARVLDQITAISGDGSHVYFVAEGALTGPSSEGKSPSTAAGARNLYAWEIDAANPSGKLSFIGAVSASDGAANPQSEGLWGSKGSFRNEAYPVPVTGTKGAGEEVGGDGHVLLFESVASLTADDTDGGFRDVFRYDADNGNLQRISKAAPDGSDNGAFGVVARDLAPAQTGGVGGPDFVVAGRWASEDGDTVVFDTAEGLVPGDVNGVFDFYVWHQGQLARLPGLQPGTVGTFGAPIGSKDVVLSPTGGSIAFTSVSRLLPEDADRTESVYVARAGGGFPSHEEDDPCIPEQTCQLRSPQPSQATPASETASAGNVTEEPATCRKGYVRRQGKCVKKPCRRGYVRRQGKCVKKHPHHKRAHKHQKRNANENRRAAR